MPAHASISLAPFPRRINVEPTNHCNQRCRLCPRLGFTRPLGFLSMERFARVADECAQHETALWLHFLGEPLLHRDLVAMLRRAKRAGVRRVGLSTNAVSLRGQIAEELLDCGLDRLECSMDAGDRDSYRAARGRDHFERARRNVEAFLLRKRERGLATPVVSIQFLRTPAVEAQLAALVEAWRPHLGPRDFVMTIDPAPFGDAIDVDPAMPAELERSESGKRARGERSELERSESGKRARGERSELERSESSKQARGERSSPARPPCAWLFSSLVILQDGTVVMCGADWDAHVPLGHVDTATIAEIWHGAEAARRRRAHLAGRFAEAGPCGTCRDWRLADGGGYRNALVEIDARRAAAGGAP